MSKVNIVLQSPDSDAQQYDWLNVTNGNDPNEVQKIINHLRAGLGGMRSISGQLDLNAPIASGSVSIVNASVAHLNTLTIGQQALTAVSANPAANQFLIGSSSTATVSNLLGAITAGSILPIITNCVANGGTLSVSSMYPGYIGNEIKMSTSNTAGFTITQLSGGSGVVSTFNLQ